MRLLFIAGFGEEDFIFDHLHPLLPGKKLFLNFWNLLPDTDRPHWNVALFVEDLIRQFQITAHDVVIGHSTGGWVAMFIKQQVGCRVVQLASWTDLRKLALPPISRRLLFWLVRRGLYFHPVVLRWVLKRHYQGKPSASVFKKVFTRLMRGNKENIVNQLRLIWNEPSVRLTATPDLRIHARGDILVRFPDEQVQEVLGDHFSLYTYPSAVAAPILSLLEKQKQT